MHLKHFFIIVYISKIIIDYICHSRVYSKEFLNFKIIEILPAINYVKRKNKLVSHIIYWTIFTR